MAITTYAELQTAVGNWLNRADLTARIPEFITLAEAKMRRLLRDQKAVSGISMVAGVNVLGLPTTCKILTSLRYNTSTYQFALTEVTPTALAGLRGTASGVPQFYTYVAGGVYFDVTPDSNYLLEMVYVLSLPALGAINTVNDTLLNSPDIYLYGALVEAAPYLEHDERLQTWGSLFGAAISDENTFRERTELGANPVMSLPVVFGGEC